MHHTTESGSGHLKMNAEEQKIQKAGTELQQVDSTSSGKQVIVEQKTSFSPGRPGQIRYSHKVSNSNSRVFYLSARPAKNANSFLTISKAFF